jgi:multidrug efflux pump subunit AcrB
MIIIFNSVRLAFTMIFILPLAMIGASWGMLLFGKPSSMPSMVGILLLFGIVINNTIIITDFYKKYRLKEGPYESAMESIKVRFRPVMMTTFGTIAGMIPIALEQAVGLERLSPLADVAIGGVIVGSFLTLVYLPMFAYSLDKGK